MKRLYSPEAEQSVLGGLMIDDSKYDEVKARLAPEDFHDKRHKVLFEYFGKLKSRELPLDMIAVGEALESTNKVTAVGGVGYLADLVSQTPSVANIAIYADIVRKFSIQRQLLGIPDLINEHQDDAMGSLVAVQNLINDLAQGFDKSEPVEIRQTLKPLIEYLEAHMDSDLCGEATGFADIDNKTGGLQGGDLVFLAARPSMGKTALALNIAANYQKPVLIFSLEMPKLQLTQRMVSALGEIPFEKVRRPKDMNDEDWHHISEVSGKIGELPIYIDDQSQLTATQVKSRSLRLAKTANIGLIIVDYLQIMRPEERNATTERETAQLSRSLKSLAKDLNIPVIALSQLSRAVENRENKRPRLSDLRYSGAIEQDADMVWFLYRDEYYHKIPTNLGVAELNVAKQRNGEIGNVLLRWRGQYQRFDNFAGVYEPYTATARRAGFDG